MKPPPVITPVSDSSWPTLGKGESFFDRALANGHLEGEAPHVNGVDGPGASSALDEWEKDEILDDDVEPEEGWDLDAAGDGRAATNHEEELTPADSELGAGATPGVNPTEIWTRNSPFAGDHVAAGSFETAMQVRGTIIAFSINC